MSHKLKSAFWFALLVNIAGMVYSFQAGDWRRMFCLFHFGMIVYLIVVTRRRQRKQRDLDEAFEQLRCISERGVRQ
jgi:lysylphosphatidylglycerol synthetase-like protein (DUF2156 family)